MFRNIAFDVFYDLQQWSCCSRPYTCPTSTYPRRSIPAFLKLACLSCAPGPFRYGLTVREGCCFSWKIWLEAVWSINGKITACFGSKFRPILTFRNWCCSLTVPVCLYPLALVNSLQGSPSPSLPMTSWLSCPQAMSWSCCHPSCLHLLQPAIQRLAAPTNCAGQPNIPDSVHYIVPVPSQ